MLGHSPVEGPLAGQHGNATVEDLPDPPVQRESVGHFGDLPAKQLHHFFTDRCRHDADRTCIHETVPVGMEITGR